MACTLANLYKGGLRVKDLTIVPYNMYEKLMVHVKGEHVSRMIKQTDLKRCFTAHAILHPTHNTHPLCTLPRLEKKKKITLSIIVKSSTDKCRICDVLFLRLDKHVSTTLITALSSNSC